MDPVNPASLVGATSLVSLVPIGVWITVIVLAVRASRTWGSVETAVNDIGKKIDKVGDRVKTLEEQTGTHSADIAYIRGKME